MFDIAALNGRRTAILVCGQSAVHVLWTIEEVLMRLENARSSGDWLALQYKTADSRHS
jgi:hypothetical protein